MFTSGRNGDGRIISEGTGVVNFNKQRYLVAEDKFGNRYVYVQHHTQEDLIYDFPVDEVNEDEYVTYGISVDRLKRSTKCRSAFDLIKLNYKVDVIEVAEAKLEFLFLPEEYKKDLEF